MLVAVDVGNSAIKFGAFDGGRLVAVERIEFARSLAEDVIPPAHLLVADEVVGIASAPGRVAEFSGWCPVPVRFLGDEARAAFVTSYTDPHELGLDRIAAAMGARARLGGGAIVIAGIGTAVTVDVLTADDRLLAIAIAPGLRAGADGLRAAAPHLPGVDLAPGPVVLPAEGTADSMRAGHVLGLAGLVDRLADEAARNVGRADGPAPAFVLCGGGAEALAQHLRTSFVREPDLVLWGISELHRVVPR